MALKSRSAGAAAANSSPGDDTSWLAATDARSSDLMADAELQGSDGHGVIRLLPYARRIRAGGINLHPDIKVVQERPGMALLDGDNGMGHLVMKKAADMAVEKARTCGIAWVGSRLSNHAGPASLYARMPMAHDMIGMYFAVGNANHLPAWAALHAAFYQSYRRRRAAGEDRRRAGLATTVPPRQVQAKASAASYSIGWISTCWAGRS